MNLYGHAYATYRQDGHTITVDPQTVPETGCLVFLEHFAAAPRRQHKPGMDQTVEQLGRPSAAIEGHVRAGATARIIQYSADGLLVVWHHLIQPDQVEPVPDERFVHYAQEHVFWPIYETLDPRQRRRRRRNHRSDRLYRMTRSIASDTRDVVTTVIWSNQGFFVFSVLTVGLGAKQMVSKTNFPK